MLNFVCSNFRQRNRRKINSLVIVYIGKRWQWQKQTIDEQRRAPPAQ